MSKIFRCSGFSLASLAYFASPVPKLILTAALSLAGAAALAPDGAGAREIVAFPQSYRPGMIVIKESERRLYFVRGDGTAIRYPVAIGKAGKAWQGETYVQGKYVRPSWSAPDVVRADHPYLTGVIPGGSPRNPMGAAALTLGAVGGRHPRHHRKHAPVGRHGGVLRLHPHAE